MLKTALIYDWLVAIGGGERTLAAICDIYPAPIYTLVEDKKKLADTSFAELIIHPSFLQKLPFTKRIFRHFLPLFPFAIEQFDLSEYELILSTSHAVAKGVLTRPHQLHLCYCFTPMRYAWDLTHQYLSGVKGLKKLAAKLSLHYLRNWDVASVGRVDHFAAISHHVAKRIKKFYSRESTVIYPPVDVDLIACCLEKEDFYLTVSRMVPYKRIDLIVESFSKMPQKKLVVIGEGPEMRKIKSKAAQNVEILGHQPDAVIHDYMRRAKGFVFAAEEDFGIVVVEAQAAGTPVIAFGKGASLETVIEGETGIFFSEQSVESVIETIERFEKKSFFPEKVRENALRFSRERFQREFKQFVDLKIKEHHESHYPSRG